MAFTPLHVHTEHSSLDGLARLTETARAASAYGFEACALTDHGTPGGLWAFAQECKRLGVKPIPGIEIYLSIGSRHSPQTMEVYADDGMGDADDQITTEAGRRTKQKKYYHLSLLAKNRTGWHNLIRFHNESQRTKIGKHPAGDWDLLKQYGEGLVLLTGCLASPVAGPLAQIQFCEDPDGEDACALREDAHAAVDHMIEAVGAENVFVEVMDHGIASERYVIEELYDLAEDRDLTVVATNDSHYLDCEDDHAHEAFLSVGTGSSMHDETRFRFNGSGYHFKTEEQMRQTRPDDQLWQEAIDNTGLVAEMVAADTVPEPEIRLPKFPLPEDQDSADEYLRQLVEDGAAWRYGTEWRDDDEITERIDHELSVVSDMGYSDYFLITWDIIEFARAESITTGPGRGSSAGAIIAYTLGITDLCPLRYHLLFERFLERGRVGMPDIDMDFPKHKRHLIHAYCQTKYGADHVAHIGGFNKAQTKAAIKDATRVFVPHIDKKTTGSERDRMELQRKEVYQLGDRLAKIVEFGDNKSQPFARLDEPQSEEEKLRAEEFWTAVDHGGELAGQIIEVARRFEGVSKNETIHPCGFVISTDPLFDMVPLRPVSKDAAADEPQVIVWDGDMVEDFGLLKMDFLGIQNLDYIDLTFEYLARRGEDGLPQSVDDIPDPDGDEHGHLSDDADAAYRMLAAGRTAGLFQLDSAGMTKVVTDIAPEDLNDLSAAVALYRPGPISANMPEDYAAKKHGRREESYDRLTTDENEIDWLSEVLGETFQSVVYQEQAMRLGQVVAGFDDIQRSTLRKAIGKKKKDLMDRCSEWWFDGYGKEFEKNGELVSPVFSRESAERVWEFIQGSADYAFNKSHSAAYALLAYWTAYLKANYPVEYGAAMLATSDNDQKRLLVLADLKAEGIEIGVPAVNESDQHTVPASGQIRLGLGEIKDVGKVAANIIEARADAGDFSSLHDFATRVESITVTALRALIESGAMDIFGPRRGLLKTLYAAKKVDLDPVGEDFGAVERDRRQRRVLGTVVGSTTLDHVDIDDVGQGIGPEEEPLEVYRLDHLGAGDRSACHLGVVSEFRSMMSKSGRMSKMVIEDTAATEVVIFPQSHRQMVQDYGQPEVGDLVVVAGKVQTSTYGNDEDQVTPRREILANRVWIVLDPTRVEDQPVETSELVDALEATVEPESPAEENISQDDDEQPVPVPELEDNGRRTSGDSAADEGPAPAAPLSWMLALVVDEVPGSLNPGAGCIMRSEGARSEDVGVSVSRHSPMFIDRKQRVAIKLIEGSDWEAEWSQLCTAAGV
ncbi:MAG: DNA polymerase III subunit alpha [Nesterenkonia sp.]